MSLIEGIGDEVTIVLGGFLLCVILMFAWLSTHTADIPLLREVGVIVVELRQRRSRLNAVNEDRPERGDTSNSSDPGRQIQETSDTQNIAESPVEISNASVERIPVSLSSPPNDNASTQGGISEILPSSGPVLFDTEAGASNSGQTNITGSLLQDRPKCEDQTSLNDLNESETLVPKASVVIDDNKGFAFPNEEEVRQRRVQYFQTNKSAPDISGESMIYSRAEDNGPSSLSDTTAYDYDSTRQLPDSNQASNQPTVDSNKVVELTQQGVAQAASQLGAIAEADLDDGATTSLQEDISDIQMTSVPGESSKIRVKLKYMNETQRLVYAKPLDTIGEFRRANFQEELQDNKWVRFIYNGQDLRDDNRTLQACNIGDNCTMHCLITAQTQPHPSRDTVLEEDEDSFMGMMMYPLFTVIILIVWYFRFTYRQYFSAMSTVCLIGVSFLLALSYISSLRTPDRTPQQQRTGSSSPAARGGGGIHQEHQHSD